MRELNSAQNLEARPPSWRITHNKKAARFWETLPLCTVENATKPYCALHYGNLLGRKVDLPSTNRMVPGLYSTLGNSDLPY